MKKIKELRIYNNSSQFVYEVGKPVLQHDHKTCNGIYHARPPEIDQERFCVHLDDGSEVIWNAANVSGYRVTSMEWGKENVTD